MGNSGWEWRRKEKKKRASLNFAWRLLSYFLLWLLPQNAIYNNTTTPSIDWVE